MYRDGRPRVADAFGSPAVGQAHDGSLPDIWREPPAVFDALPVRSGDDEADEAAAI